MNTVKTQKFYFSSTWVYNFFFHRVHILPIYHTALFQSIPVIQSFSDTGVYIPTNTQNRRVLNLKCTYAILCREAGSKRLITNMAIAVTFPWLLLLCVWETDSSDLWLVLVIDESVACLNDLLRLVAHNTGAGTRVWYCKLLLCTQIRHRTNTCGGSSGGPPVLPSTNLNSKSRMHIGRLRIHETSGGTGHNRAKRRHLTGRQVCRKETVCILSLSITLGD
jgi:hypothetical protein